MEEGGVCRRKRAGMVNRTMKKRVVQRLDWKGERSFLGLLLNAIFGGFGKWGWGDGYLMLRFE